jgi:hypothetical protein
MQWPTRGWYGVYRQFQQYFSDIVVFSFNGGVIRSTWRNHRPAASH